jgi:hypothetical protein
MGNSDSVMGRQMIKRGPKKRFLSEKFRRGTKLWQSALVADHNQPKSDGPRVVACPSVKSGDPHFVPVIKQTKVSLLEVSNGQSALGILADDID